MQEVFPVPLAPRSERHCLAVEYHLRILFSISTKVPTLPAYKSPTTTPGVILPPNLRTVINPRDTPSKEHNYQNLPFLTTASIPYNPPQRPSTSPAPITRPGGCPDTWSHIWANGRAGHGSWVLMRNTLSLTRTNPCTGQNVLFRASSA